MASLKFLLQAATSSNHGDLLNQILRSGFSDALISVAFARVQGVQAIIDSLEKEGGEKLTVFIGVRNGITSYQAIDRLLQCGAQIYVVDTGSATTIFHPKLFAVRAGEIANILIGSANLTLGGLYNNIEASTRIQLYLREEMDARFFSEVWEALNLMRRTFPSHVIRVSNGKDVKDLFELGLLVDETIAIETSQNGRNERKDDLPLMPLYRRLPISTLKRTQNRRLVDQIAVSNGAHLVQNTLLSFNPTERDFYLVWQSLELSERDLNIPRGPNTNPTGSMYWKQGAYDDIDQRHYFREEIFSGLDWVVDQSLPHYERSFAKFHMRIKGNYEGTFFLKLSHNTNVESATYKQFNSMTQISWGPAKPVIAKRGLLGRIMYLYRKDINPPEYMIEID